MNLPFYLYDVRDTYIPILTYTDFKSLDRIFLLHLVNMSVVTMPFSLIKIINDKIVDLIKYRVKIIKHIFNYNNINKIGLMNKQLKLVILDEYICD